MQLQAWSWATKDVGISFLQTMTRSRILFQSNYSSSSHRCKEQRNCQENNPSELLHRQWTLLNPGSRIHKISISEMKGRRGEAEAPPSFSNNTSPALGDSLMDEIKSEHSFFVVRDDLLHPFVNGNKARKLDALLPLLEAHSVTDVVTCGGCQSAHAAAVAVSCAEKGVRAHLLLRGWQPEVSTGYNLISTMYGNVTYVPTSVYANREEMLSRNADLLAGKNGCVLFLSGVAGASPGNHGDGTKFSSSDVENRDILAQNSIEGNPRKVAIINEGAGDAVALLGLIRLVQYLSQPCLFGTELKVKVIVDAGTGTTAVGLGLGALLFGLPWEITAVMLADTIDGYRRQEKQLVTEFISCYGMDILPLSDGSHAGGIVHWVQRLSPRKFGNVMKGELEACQRIAQQTGILVDPVYTLSAWEHAVIASQKQTDGDALVVMLHTGGTLGMFGLAQRYKSYFTAIQHNRDMSSS